MHDRGRIWLNPCRDRIDQFGSYLRGIAKRQYDENEVASGTSGVTGLIASYFRGIDVPPKCRMLGGQMATIPMIPIGSITTLNRSILYTEKKFRAPVATILCVDTVAM